MKSHMLIHATGFIVATTLASAANATLMELLIEGSMIDREGGSSYGGGYTTLDLFQPGDPFQIKLKLDTNQLTPATPNTSLQGSRYIETGSGPVVVDSAMQIDNIPTVFSLLGGSTFLPGYGECFEGPDCIDNLPAPTPALDPTLRRDYEHISMQRTIGASSAMSFEWNYGGSFARGFDPGFSVPDPYLGASLSFSLLDLTNASFDDLASTGSINYDGTGIDYGMLSVFSDEPAADGKGLWRFNYSFDVSRIALAPVSPAPEIETWLMLGIGGVIIALRLRSKRDTEDLSKIACG